MTRIRIWSLPALILFVVGGISVTAEDKDSGYKVVKKFELGGDERGGD